MPQEQFPPDWWSDLLAAINRMTLPNEQMLAAIERMTTFPNEQMQAAIERMTTFPNEQMQAAIERMTRIPQEQMQAAIDSMSVTPNEKLRAAVDSLLARVESARELINKIQNLAVEAVVSSPAIPVDGTQVMSATQSFDETFTLALLRFIWSIPSDADYPAIMLAIALLTLLFQVLQYLEVKKRPQ